MFPLLSAMLSENWPRPSILYVCPLKALLNNLEVRLAQYAGLVGRRVGLWHGDIGDGDRKRLLADPPDILLTTPESVEVMLIFRAAERIALFGSVRAIVIDELHAFAGDDRGWHLQAVLERVTRIAGHRIQRIGLSATIGNPPDLAEWLAGTSDGPRRVIAPPAASPAPPEVMLDHVGTIPNAALVISRLHRGEKRLVFCDSRARVEHLATELRVLGVETFVSHSSVSLDERRRAETAFSEGQNCVIVATSTLELGVDVGDLDRVIQVDSPATVASFLQRLGRTGRRPGTVRNCLFLTTSDDSFLQAAGLLTLWGEGFVEPVVPPPEPFHVLAQQVLALVLQEGRVGRSTWREWIGRLPVFAAMRADDVEGVIDQMVAEQVLVEDEGMLSMGPEGERLYGRKHFISVLSVFTGEQLFRVLIGKEELGFVHDSTFVVAGDGPAVLSLAGRSWTVKHVDWSRRLAYVEPSADKGRSRWIGDSRPLGFTLCRAMRRALIRDNKPSPMTRRAEEKLAELRAQYSWLDEESTVLTTESEGEVRWWTFAGVRANQVLATALTEAGSKRAKSENPSLPVTPSSPTFDPRPAAQAILSRRPEDALDALDPDAEDTLKFAACLPAHLRRRVLIHRALDLMGAATVAQEPLRRVSR